MKVGSLFAGIGGFDLGFERAGFEVAWCVEIDRNARAVLARRFPKARILEDVTKVDPHDLETVDVICGGFPCQDLSVAGKRAGLAGERSGLFHDAMRIVRTVRPRLLVLENVPGLLSSNRGLDFATVLREVGEGWACAEVGWRVLDSQYCGVAQRRRRVFIVGSARIGCAEEVLALAESSGRSPPSRGEARQAVAATIAARFGISRNNHEECVVQPFSPHGHYRYEASDQSATLQDRENRQGGHTHLVAQAFGISEELTAAEDVMPTIQRGGDGGRHEFVAQAFRKSKRAQSASDDETWVDDGIANTLNGFDTGDARTTHIVCEECGHQHDEGRVCLECGNDLVCDTFDFCSDCLKADAEKRNQTISFHPTQDPISDTERTHALGCGSKQGCATVAVATPMIVRRLTPIECERLQGFPDGWTDTGTPEKPTADSHRYKQLGNAVTVNVAEWIAKRAHEALTREAP